MIRNGWRRVRTAVLGIALTVICLVAGLATNVRAQPGPYSAQIQAALRTFIATAHTWTGTQTFNNITVGGTCTGCGGGGAPSTSKYIVQGTADAGLSAAQFLGSLATGIVKNTTTTGVLSIAAAGTDYLAPAGSGTGLVYTTGSITALGGNFSTVGAFTLAFTVSGNTGVTLPTSGTLQTTTGTPAGFIIASQATGDLLYASGASAWTRLGVGSNTNVLTLAGGVPTWAASAAAAAGTLTGTTLASNVVTASINSLTQTISNTSQPRALAYNSGTQSATSGADLLVTFDSEVYDVGSMHSTVSNTSRMTIPAGGDGLYLVIGKVWFGGSVTGIQEINIYKNGTELPVAGRAWIGGGTGGAQYNINSQILSLVAGDYIEIAAFQNSGGSMTIGSASALNANALTIVKLW